MSYPSNLQIVPQIDRESYIDEPSLRAVEIELSIVIPCLNEADTLAYCIEAAAQAIEENGIAAEIVVADNGSSDASPQIALSLGARVVHVHEKGYGNALMGGIAASRGKYIIMGDADASYDFAEIPKFLAKLREGYRLVQGCRLASGGGTVLPGAMPFLHKWFGNPFFSMIVKRIFNAPINDVNCGLRGFSKELYKELDQRCTGMEFAVEMVVKASLSGAPICEVPITLHPDKRINTAKHLKTFRDGWRTLRFFLLCSPRWLFLYPGVLLILLGASAFALAMPGTVIAGIGLDVHSLILASCLVIIGHQAILFSISAKTFAITEGLLPPDPKFSRLFKFFTLERGLITGSISCILGLLLILATFDKWRLSHFGMLNYQEGLRLMVPGVLLCTLGFQTILGSFFLSILGLRRS